MTVMTESKELNPDHTAHRRRNRRLTNVLGSIMIAGFLVVLVGGVLLSVASPATAAAGWGILVVGVIVTGSLIYGVFLLEARRVAASGREHCLQCGEIVAVNSRFCMKCGARIQ